MLYATPNGTQDLLALRFWNATDACCDFFGSGVDDSTYLANLVAAIDSAVGVDPRRRFFVGHSNGGFMSYRMACDHADEVAAVVSIAGATFDDTADCAPVRPVSTLQIHGTSDTVDPVRRRNPAGGRRPLSRRHGNRGKLGRLQRLRELDRGARPVRRPRWSPGRRNRRRALRLRLRRRRDRTVDRQRRAAFTGDQRHAPRSGDRFPRRRRQPRLRDGFETGFTLAWSSSVGEV